jgi:octaprenyl-diphosphate synthase
MKEKIMINPRDYLADIELVLDKWLPEKPDAQWIERVFHRDLPPESAEQLVQPCRDLLKRGGKRWRPLLMVLTAEALGGMEAVEKALPLTPLVEFPHTASLIHDDIEDRSDYRRGKAAIHILYGEDTAINCGAFLYFLPLAILDEQPDIRLYRTWSEHMRRLHIGQGMDIAWHRNPQKFPSQEDYITMCRLKTGCLASLAASMGVICAGALAKETEFCEAVENLGVGFQILDDIKNLTTGLPGKRRGDDVVEGKKSLPVLLYLRQNPEQQNFITSSFAAAREGGISAPEVEAVIGALTESGVLEEAQKTAETLIGRAQDFLGQWETLSTLIETIT